MAKGPIALGEWVEWIHPRPIPMEKKKKTTQQRGKADPN
jgi:hypothetical protein